MRFPIVINSKLGFILHRLSTTYPWQTNHRRTTDDKRQPRHKLDSYI